MQPRVICSSNSIERLTWSRQTIGQMKKWQTENFDLQLEPLGPRDSMTYFNNHKNIGASSEMRISGYDRLHDRTPYDQSKPRCDRIKRDAIWREIHEENKLHKVAIITSHWHGRPNRVELDFHDGKFSRTNEIRDNFYRRNGFDLL